MSYNDSKDNNSIPTDLLTSALQLMSQEWSKLQQDENDEAIAATSDVEIMTKRITALLLARLVAVVYDRQRKAADEAGTAPQEDPPFADYATVTICRTLLVQPEVWPGDVLTPTVVQELQTYVGTILQHYYPTTVVPYHNAEHATHVTMSIAKLLDMLLSRKFGQATLPPTFGLRYNPLALFSLVLAGLIHDVEHTGVGNRVLATEDHDFAVQYNDQSVAEHRSLYVAFDEFLAAAPGTDSSCHGTKYSHLRQALCPTKEEYHNLRKFTINLVLGTDIASPEKTQFGRSMWKEAFHEEISRRRSQTGGGDAPHSPVKKNKTLKLEANQNSGDVSGDELSQDTFLTDSDEATVEESDHGHGNPEKEEEPVQEQAPPPVRVNTTRYQRRRQGQVKPPEPTPMKPIVRSANKKRLGIRQSMDLSGQVTVEYAAGGGKTTPTQAALLEADQPDELKMAVVMEVLMQAADVAHNLQSWDHMVEWSCRLYLELRRAFIQGRGPDVAPNWFKNQIGFLEMYLEPLAKKLDTTGVFGPLVGPSFLRIVKSSRDRWLLDGMEVTQAVLEAGAEWYPDDEPVEALPTLPSRNGGESSSTPDAVQNVTPSADLQQELEKTKKQLEQQSEEQSKKYAALQKMLDDKEAALATLQNQLKQQQIESQEYLRPKVQQEQAVQTTAVSKEALVETHDDLPWQKIVMVIMGVALLWACVRVPALNNLCAPAAPGTQILNMKEHAIWEAPWWAPDSYKETAFRSVCGSNKRARMRIERRKKKIFWTQLDDPKTSKPRVVTKAFAHATVESDKLSVTNKRGKTTVEEAPWYHVC